MATYLIHDTRFIGNTPHNLSTGYLRVNEMSPIQMMINRTISFANSHQGRISNLNILAHGMNGAFQTRRFGMSFQTGGCGIQICRENLTAGNLNVLSSWRGKISQITLFACQIAQVNPVVRLNRSQMERASNGLVSTRYDTLNGEYFCQQMADVTGANVVASDQDQQYITYQDGRIDNSSLLQMEGNVRTFRPRS